MQNAESLTSPTLLIQFRGFAPYTALCFKIINFFSFLICLAILIKAADANWTTAILELHNARTGSSATPVYFQCLLSCVCEQPRPFNHRWRSQSERMAQKEAWLLFNGKLVIPTPVIIYTQFWNADLSVDKDYVHRWQWLSLKRGPSRGGDVAVYVCDINQPSLPTPFYSGLVSVSVLMVLSTVFHSMNSPNNSPPSHSVLPVLFLPYWPF